MTLKANLAAALLLSATFALPALAQPVVPVVTQTAVPVVAINLNSFIGQTLFGVARAPLGTVTQVDPYAGVVAVAGRHGEFALISASMMLPDGPNLWAPLTYGDIKVASDMNLRHPGATMTGPKVIIIEPAIG